MTRRYKMTKRARLAELTHDRIIEATEVLLTNGPLSSVTLPAIAKSAKVSVQTIMRRMGSLEGCLAAVAKEVTERTETQRGNTEPGDIDSAISALIYHYESENSLILNLLEQVKKNESFTKKAVETGRIYHRNWVVHCFGPLLNDINQENIDALVAATDIYLYKLLRLDLGRSINHTKAVICSLVRGILEVT